MLADGQRLSKVERLITAITPKFVTHFGRNDTLDGDNIFLHVQVRCPDPPQVQMPACCIFHACKYCMVIMPSQHAASICISCGLEHLCCQACLDIMKSDQRQVLPVEKSTTLTFVSSLVGIGHALVYINMILSFFLP